MVAYHSLIFSLLCLFVSFLSAAGKECITSITRGKELKEFQSHSHVLAVLPSTSGDAEDNEVYKELCQRLESTPFPRVKDFEIALIQDSNLKRKILNEATEPKLSILQTLKVQAKKVITLIKKSEAEDQDIAEKEMKLQFVLFQKQSSETSTPSSGVRFIPKETDGSEITADDVSEFVADQLKRKKIGNFVYSLGTFDLIAAQIMKHDQDSWQQALWAKGLARFVKLLFWQGRLPFRGTEGTEFEEGLIEEYLKVGFKVLEKGKDYPSQQVSRLKNMLENEDNKLGELQKESMSQRVYILQKFAEPLTFEDADVKSFILKMAMHVGTFMLILVLIPLLLMTDADDDDHEQEEEGDEVKEENSPEEVREDDVGEELVEEQMMDDPDQEEEDDVGDEDDAGTDEKDESSKLLTKQERRALAIQRAKEAMQADKEKVQRTKENAASNATDEMAPNRNEKETLHREEELSAMTVMELRTLLRERGMRQAGRKSELVDRLLNE